MSRSKVIMISSDVVGRRMAGPAIRAVELARILSRTEEVVLAAPNDARLEGLEVISFRDRRFGRLVSQAKVIVTQGLGVPLKPILDPGPAVVMDFYDPNPVELLAHYRDKKWSEARLAQDHLRERLLVLARRGDMFLYATERQRDFWLGLLAAAGRLTWEADRRHPNLDDLLQPLPFGLDSRPPRSDRPVLKGVWPGIGPEDEVIIWNGGVWNWFDPLTVIKAVDRLKDRRPRMRLFFMGVSHPNPRIPEMAMVNRAVELSARLGLTDKHVFFNHGWVDYNRREGYLLESELAVLASGRDLETRLSFRTRVLDCLWANIPVVLTEGDYFSALTEERALGLVTPVGDDRAMAEAINKLLADNDFRATCRANLARAAAELTWERVARPLVRFCEQARPHPGARHSRAWQWTAAVAYYFKVIQLLTRWGGWKRVLDSRLAARRKGEAA